RRLRCDVTPFKTIANAGPRLRFLWRHEPVLSSGVSPVRNSFEYLDAVDDRAANLTGHGAHDYPGSLSGSPAFRARTSGAALARNERQHCARGEHQRRLLQEVAASRLLQRAARGRVTRFGSHDSPPGNWLQLISTQRRF